ncbi:MAG: hypothetical protein DMG30_26795 [Acidobacteria bacterium]|nr:MAG: hypothetical protein DMG30_26795 [Acidobacteriota bacterium]
MRMTESAKKAVPTSQRGLPGKSGTGSYPMPDAKHAAAAIGFAAMHHGPAFAARIRAKARKLGYAKPQKKVRMTKLMGR